jgi:hypothetical protein
VTLSDWARNGWLLPHRTSPQEIGDLLAIVERDLSDSQASGLSADWQCRRFSGRIYRPRSETICSTDSAIASSRSRTFTSSSCGGNPSLRLPMGRGSRTSDPSRSAAREGIRRPSFCGVGRREGRSSRSNAPLSIRMSSRAQRGSSPSTSERFLVAALLGMTGLRGRPQGAGFLDRPPRLHPLVEPSRVRSIWTPETRAACRWEQAFSPDGGRTWENWTMKFTRAGL